MCEDRNRIARECADLRDQLNTLRDEYATAMENAAKQMAAMELDTGKTINDVADRAYDDKDQVLDVVKDRCWTEGYLEGLKAARLGIEHLIAEEKKS